MAKVMPWGGGAVRISDLTESQRRTMPDQVFCALLRARIPDPRDSKEERRPVNC